MRTRDTTTRSFRFMEFDIITQEFAIPYTRLILIESR